MGIAHKMHIFCKIRKQMHMRFFVCRWYSYSGDADF